MLAQLLPAPTSISTSIVAQTVTVEHHESLSSRTIEEALDEAGFELLSTSDTDGHEHHRSSNGKHIAGMSSRKREKHTEQCVLCQREAASSDATLVGFNEGLAGAEKAEKAAVSDMRADDIELTDGPGYIASFSVGGMTCVACVVTIQDLTSTLEGVSQVAVNLLGKSATAKLRDKNLVKQFIEAIEDGGYECELVSIDDVGANDRAKSAESAARTVSLRIGGMFCM